MDKLITVDSLAALYMSADFNSNQLNNPKETLVSFSNNNELSLDMLLNQKILLLDEGHCLRDQVMSLCELPQNGHETYRGTSLETVRQMVRLDAGITLIPKIACRKDDDLVYLPLKTPSPQREILAVWRTSSPRSNFFRKLACILKKMKI